ncbi:MAG: response regulator [Roseiarcus sp.]
MYSASLASAKRRAIGQGVAETPIIHIVDDDESMREVLASLLRSVALSARVYASVDAFLQAPRADAPGCLILDVRIPGMSGLDFQARLREVGVELPVILMTAYADRVRARSARLDARRVDRVNRS